MPNEFGSLSVKALRHNCIHVQVCTCAYTMLYIHVHVQIVHVYVCARIGYVWLLFESQSPKNILCWL